MQPQTDSAFELGRTVGGLLGLAIPVLISILAVKRLSERDNSRFTALALLLAGISWFMAGGVGLVSRWTKLPALLLLAGVPAILAAAVAFVMAIIGFVQVSASGGKLKGRGQAVAAFLISLLPLGGAVVGFVKGADRVPDGWKVAGSTAGRRLTFAAKNFAFTVPGDGWVQVDPKKLNPNADLAFMRGRENMVFLLISHPIEEGAEPTLDLLTDASRQEVAQMDAQAKIDEAVDEAIGDIQGRAFAADARVQGRALTYRYWVGLTPTHLYSLVTFGEQKSRAKVIAAAKSVVRNFSVLE